MSSGIHTARTLVVCPYFEDHAIQDFLGDLATALGEQDRVIIVDDGSVELPLEASWLEDSGLRGQTLRLCRNVGHQMAIATGLTFAVENYSFENLVIMDSDGEDRPKDISGLLQGLDQTTDVSLAARKSRVESLAFKAFYCIYKFFFLLLVGKHIRFGNFMALTPFAARRLARSSETSLHVAAAVMNSKLNYQLIERDRGARYRGVSKMNWVSLVLHGLRSIMVFAETVMVRITLVALAAAVVILIAMVIMTFMKISGAAIPGWYSTGGGILLVLLVQVSFMALMMLLLSGSLRRQPISQLNVDGLIDAVDNAD